MSRQEIIEMMFVIDDLQEKYKIKFIKILYENHAFKAWLDEFRYITIKLGE